MIVPIFQQLEPIFLPVTLLLLGWFLYRSFVVHDRAALLLLILAVVIVVDAYMFAGVPIPGLAQGTIRYSEILMAIYVIGYLFGRHRADALPQTIYIRRILVLLLIFTLLFLVATLRSVTAFHDLTFSFRHIALASFLTFLISSWGFASEQDYKRFAAYLLILAGFVAVGSFQMMFSDWIFIRSPAEDTFYHAVKNQRFGSFFGNPNRLGAFYALVIPSFIVLMLNSRRFLARAAIFVCLLAVLFAFFKTFSRGSYLGLGVALTAFMFFHIKGFSLQRKLAAVLALALVIPIFAPNIYTGVMYRLFSIEEETQAATGKAWQLTELGQEELSESRPFLWRNALKIIANNPVFGVGWGLYRYADAIVQLLVHNQIQEWEARALIEAEHPHNTYLYIAAFLGNISLFVFLLILFYWYRANRAFYKECDDDELRLINFGFMSGLMGYLAAITFDYQLFEKNTAIPFWMILGLNLSILRYVYKKRQTPTA